MKKLSTLILTGFALLILATTALASGNDSNDSDRYRNEDRQDYGENYREPGNLDKDSDDRSSHHREGEKEFYGTIKQIPQGGLGTWIIDQQEVYVDHSTRFEDEYGQPQIGSRVEVKGIYQNGTFHARKIKTKH